MFFYKLLLLLLAFLWFRFLIVVHRVAAITEAQAEVHLQKKGTIKNAYTHAAAFASCMNVNCVSSTVVLELEVVTLSI